MCVCVCVRTHLSVNSDGLLALCRAPVADRTALSLNCFIHTLLFPLQTNGIQG